MEYSCPPRAAAPHARLRAMRRLHDTGVPVGVLFAPAIPWVNDHELEAVLEAARGAGAASAGYVLLRLPHEVAPLFREWLGVHHPDRAGKVISIVQSIREGRDNDPGFFTRMKGSGPWADLIRTRFRTRCKRLGLNAARLELRTDLFKKPSGDQYQMF